MVSDSVFGTRAEAPASAACSPSGSTRGADSPARPDDDCEPDSSGRARDDVHRARSPPASRAAVDDVDARLASFTRRVDATLRAMDAFDARLAETEREGTPVRARGERARRDKNDAVEDDESTVDDDRERE